jgi:hypothetical protein
MKTRFIAFLAIVLLSCSMVACRSFDQSMAPARGACGPFGTAIHYQKEPLAPKEPVACMYSYERARDNVDWLCRASANFQLLSFGFGERIGPIEAGGCLVCLTRERPDILAQMKPGKPEPAGISPSISCLGIFLPKPEEPQL